MQGWVKIHRKFQTWEWRDSPKHVAVFLDLLLEANHKEKKYRGKTILPGQLTTSYAAISERCGVSIRGVRTVLKDLKTTREVTHESFRHYSIITITNWDEYQQSDTQGDKLVTSRRQASDKLVTTNKNDKNVNNEKNEKNTEQICTAMTVYLNERTNKNYRPGSYLSLFSDILNLGYSQEDIKRVIDTKCREWKGTEMESNLTLSTLLKPEFFDKYLNQKAKEIVRTDFDQMLRELEENGSIREA